MVGIKTTEYSINILQSHLFKISGKTSYYQRNDKQPTDIFK